eukprot:4962524-Prymnesium_polylepis.1
MACPARQGGAFAAPGVRRLYGMHPNMAHALPNMACALPNMARALLNMACTLPNMARALLNMACTLPNMACRWRVRRSRRPSSFARSCRTSRAARRCRA